MVFTAAVTKLLPSQGPKKAAVRMTSASGELDSTIDSAAALEVPYTPTGLGMAVSTYGSPVLPSNTRSDEKVTKRMRACRQARATVAAAVTFSRQQRSGS